MKHLILTATLFLTGACGSSIDKLANSIDNASSTAKTIQCDQKNNKDASCPTTTTSTQNRDPSNVNTTSSTNTNEQTQSDTDILDNTSWVTACERGITFKASFAKGIETLTTNIYQDDACQVIEHSQNQSLTYAVEGDSIEFNEGAANVFITDAPFQTISTDGNTLSFSGNETQVYTHF